MRKILSLLSVFTITASAATSVASCGKTDLNEIVVQMNKKWADGYTPAIASINAKFTELGLPYKAVAKELDVFENYDKIAKNGVRDINTPDIFMLGFDRYSGYKDQNNIVDLSSQIKNILLADDAGKSHFDLGLKNNEIFISDDSWSKSVWETSRITTTDGDYYGMIPSSIENMIWVFDETKLGIVDGQLVGAYADGLEDKTASIENLAIVNSSRNDAGAFFRTVDGYYGGNALNGILNANQDKISPIVDGSSKAVVWQKSGEFPSKIASDFTSIWEDKQFADTYRIAFGQMASLGYSYGSDFRKTMYNSSTDDALVQLSIEKVRSGVTAMSAIGPWDLQSYVTLMKEANANANIGTAAISQVKLTNDGDATLSGFAGGYGWAVKSTIANVENSTTEGKSLTKLDAAAMVINELSLPEFAPGLAKGDGKVSAFKDSFDKSIEQFQTANDTKIIAEAFTEIADSYSKGQVTLRPNTALFDIFWGAWANSYKLAMNTSYTDVDQAIKQFNDQFLKKWKTDKDGFVFE